MESYFCLYSGINRNYQNSSLGEVLLLHRCGVCCGWTVKSGLFWGVSQRWRVHGNPTDVDQSTEPHGPHKKIVMPVTYRYLNTSNTSAPVSWGEGRHRSHLCAFSLLFSASFSRPSRSLCVFVCIGSFSGLLTIQHLMWCQIQCSEAEISRKWRTERSVMNIHKPAKSFFCWKEAASVCTGNSCPN